MDWSGGYQRASESGIDLTLLESSLSLPLAERLRQNAQMVQLCDTVRRANPHRAPGHEDMIMAAPDFQGLIKILVDNQVDFVLIGALAMIYHGSSHVTRDVNVCYSRSPANIQRLAQALAPLHPYMRGAPAGLPFRFDAPTIQADLNFTLTTDLGPFDLLGEVSGIGFYEQALARSEAGDFLGFPIRVLSIEGLIAAKIAAGRFKDQSHVLELEELKNCRRKRETNRSSNVPQLSFRSHRAGANLIRSA
jgi:hypothetical protein